MKRLFAKYLVLAVAIMLGAGVCYAQDPLKKPQKRTEQKQTQKGSSKSGKKQSSKPAAQKPAKTSSEKSDSRSEPKPAVLVNVQTGAINGHEWTDLGLPSGLKWATCNVGASVPEGYGDFFAWGETVPKEQYLSTNSDTAYKEFPWLAENGYVDSAGNLTTEHDAARQNWGGTWRIPTFEEFDELIMNTTTVWTTLNGVPGVLFTSLRNGATLFLPAGGWFSEELQSRNVNGTYQCSRVNQQYKDVASAFSIVSFDASTSQYSPRYMGRNVRAVTY